MRVIKGVVIYKNKMIMDIRSEYGSIITVKNAKKIKMGEKVFISYDFEKLRPKHIWTEKDMTNLNEAMPPVPKSEEVGDPNIDIFEDLDLIDVQKRG